MRTDLTNRRALLAGLGVAGAGVIAGCASASNGAGSTPSATSSAAAATSAGAPPSSAPAAVTSSAAPTSAAATSAAPATSAAAAGFTVPKTKVPVGTGVYFSDDAVIITQPTAGQFKAFSSVCTHMGCPVTQFTGGHMQCPCHGSEYSITDGSVIQGPAPSPLAKKTVTVEGSNLVVAKS